MLNLFQHLIKSRTYETLKRVQGDRPGLFTRSSIVNSPQTELNRFYNIECLKTNILFEIIQPAGSP